MKIKNKKTGEIVTCIKTNEYNRIVVVGRMKDGNDIVVNGYNSLAELCDEWEDYAEPKGHFVITCDGKIITTAEEFTAINECKEIGNYFETREEAEEAVKKLKAWKRLKNNGLKFRSWRTFDLGADKYYFVVTAESDGAGKGDLDLLFGGKE